MSLSISIQDIWFSYNPAHQLFSNLSICLPEDKTVLLTGENGVGKTTFASLAAGLLKPLKGKIVCTSNGRVMEKKGNLYHELSYLRQSTADNVLCASVKDELSLWLNIPDSFGKETDMGVDRLLQEWELTHIKDTPVWDLSSGELKSLALAGITSHRSRFWILDEPMASLDENHKNIFMNKLKAKQQINRGMLIISHSIKEYEPIADTVFTLTYDGIIQV